MSDSSRQRSYQKRQADKGLCALCPKPIFKWKRCRKHYKRALADYEKARERKGRIVRYATARVPAE
jgi:hypothetical protein